MPNMAEYNALLAEIAAEWDTAEKNIKAAELVSNQVVFPSIKELRYAGRRIVDFIRAINEGKSDQDIRQLLADAKFDCYRARHDAIDVVISTIAVELDLIVKRLGYNAVLEGFPGYRDLLVKITDAQESIGESRSHRNNRDTIYGAIEGVEFDSIVKTYRELKTCEPIIRGLAKSGRWHQFIGYLLFAITIVCGFVWWWWADFPTSFSRDGGGPP